MWDFSLTNVLHILSMRWMGAAIVVALCCKMLFILHDFVWQPLKAFSDFYWSTVLMLFATEWHLWYLGESLGCVCVCHNISTLPLSKPYRVHWESGCGELRTSESAGHWRWEAQFRFIMTVFLVVVVFLLLLLFRPKAFPNLANQCYLQMGLYSFWEFMV